MDAEVSPAVRKLLMKSSKENLQMMQFIVCILQRMRGQQRGQSLALQSIMQQFQCGWYTCLADVF